MIDYAAARARLAELGRTLPAESVPLAQALGRVLAEPLQATAPLPTFRNSAMDGYAVVCTDAGLPAGCVLDVHGSSAAGSAPAVISVGAIEIMTGAALPDACAAVIPVEQTEALADTAQVRLLAAVRAGQFVRAAGADIAAGQLFAQAGQQVEPALLGICAALGIAALPVRRRPRVALLCTGRELVDDPAVALQPGQIRNSSRAYLEAALARAGAELVHAQTLGDEPAAFVQALQSGATRAADLVLSTGAVSMGRHDFIPAALQGAGAEILFHKVRIQPGKPILAARLADGRGMLSLPGNPVSTAVGLRFFVEPLLRRMLGMDAEIALRLPLRQAFGNPSGLHRFLKGRCSVDADGRLQAEILSGQESFRMLPMLHSNAWISVPADTAEWPAGSRVDCYGLAHTQAPEIATAPESSTGASA